MNALYTVSLIVKAIDQLTAPVRAMRRAIEGLDDVARRARGMQEWGQQTAMAGAMVAAQAVALVGAFAAPLSASMEFGAAMSGVAAVSGATRQEMELLRATAKELGATTSFSASEAAAGMAIFGQAGFKANEIVSALPPTLALARAGGMSLANAAELAGDTMKSFGLKASEVARISDVLAATAASASLGLEDAKTALVYISPVASAVGVSLEEAAAMMGVLADGGVKGSMGGTAMAAVLTRLAAPAGEAAASLAALGVSTMDGMGNIRNYKDILTDLSGALAGMGTGRRMAYLTEIFGAENIKGIKPLLMAAENGNLAAAIASKMDGVTGSAERMAATMSDDLAGDVVSLRSAMEGLFITLGDSVSPMMRDLTQAATGLVRGLNAWAGEHPGLAKGLMILVGGLGGILAVAAPVLLLSGTLATTFGLMGTGAAALLKGFTLVGSGLKLVASAIRIVSLALAANPIGLLITAIAVAAGLIYAYWEPIKAYFVGLWADIKGIFEKGVLSGILKILWAFNPAAWMARTFNGIIEFLTGFNLFDAGAKILSTLWEGMKSMAPEPAKLMESIVGAVRDYLPFSPAKVGPLRDLNRIRLVETVAEGMKPAPMVNAMRSVTAATMLAAGTIPAMAAPLERTGSGAFGAPGSGITIHQEIQVTVSGGPFGPDQMAQLQAGLKASADDLIREIEARAADAARRNF